jgi:hypothetical protein
MTSLHKQLKAWQFREWGYTVALLLASVLLIATVVLAVACFADYRFDTAGETPYWLRVTGLVLQVVLAVGLLIAGFCSIKAPDTVELASRAEQAFPHFDHRLVTALQLNRTGAKTGGMSAELIADVTREAGELSSKERLTNLADPQRLWNAALLLIPVVLISGFFLVFFHSLSMALLQRQALMDVEIPRSVELKNTSNPVYPASDPLTLQVNVTGEWRESDIGKLTMKPGNGGIDEDYVLKFDRKLDDGSAIFIAELPPISVPFTFKAKLNDGRMRTAAAVDFAPRPVVTTIEAWVLAPVYVDPEGKRRYEKLANQGDASCHPDCALRVEAVCSKGVKMARVIQFGKQVEVSTMMTISEDGLRVSATFDVAPGATMYRIEVADEYGFANLQPPRRSINVLPDRPPTVTLNDEVLMHGSETAALDDFEVRGMPLVVGGQIQIGYTARSPLGCAKAYVVYRVNDGDWTLLGLTPVVANEEEVGKFRPDLGVFTSYDVDQNVEFYQIPSPDPDSEAPGLSAGGRYNFKTAALVKVKNGQSTKLEVGDRVEFRVAVYDRKPGQQIPVTQTELANRLPDQRVGLGRPAGYSESRIKAVVTTQAFDQWRDQQSRSRERLRDIERLQRGVFGQRTIEK